MKILIVILAVIFISGCSTVAKDYRYMPKSKHANENGMVLVQQIELNKSGTVKSIPSSEMSFDTREPNLWTKYVTPILQRTAGMASENVPTN